jgi:hypothetical protein
VNGGRASLLPATRLKEPGMRGLCLLYKTRPLLSEWCTLIRLFADVRSQWRPSTCLVSPWKSSLLLSPIPSLQYHQPIPCPISKRNLYRRQRRNAPRWGEASPFTALPVLHGQRPHVCKLRRSHVFSLLPREARGGAVFYRFRHPPPFCLQVQHVGWRLLALPKAVQSAPKWTNPRSG